MRQDGIAPSWQGMRRDGMEPWSALGSRLFLVFVMSGCSVLGWRRTPPVDWAAGGTRPGIILVPTKLLIPGGGGLGRQSLYLQLAFASCSCFLFCLSISSPALATNQLLSEPWLQTCNWLLA